MADSEVTIASAALAIAIAALLIALGQLIQQLFGTADGYRRCQSSVIGGWSTLARRRFRWYVHLHSCAHVLTCRLTWKVVVWLEVRVTTPHFEIMPFEGSVVGKHMIALDGTSHSRQRTFTRTRLTLQETTEFKEDEDAVSWTSLLTAIHDSQQLQLLGASQASRFLLEDGNSDKLEFISSLSDIVFAIPKNRSWDLMPPDVVRPLASTTLGTLVAIAHRLGMVFMDFTPRDGKIRAEGLGQSLSATLLRGMGIVVEYNVEPGSRPRRNWQIFQSLHVPSSDADKVRKPCVLSLI